MARRITEAKLSEWMGKYANRLINLSAAICRDRHRGEEIVQEAFIKLWQQPPTAPGHAEEFYELRFERQNYRLRREDFVAALVACGVSSSKIKFGRYLKRK